MYDFTGFISSIASGCGLALTGALEVSSSNSSWNVAEASELAHDRVILGSTIDG